MRRRTFIKGAATVALAGLPFDSVLTREMRANAVPSPLPDRSGQWLQFRGDRALVGRCSLPGNIKDPAIAWKHFCGSRETLYAAEFHPQHKKRATVSLATTDMGIDPRNQADERNKALASYTSDKFGPSLQVGKFLPQESGLQVLDCESCFEKYDSYQPPGTHEFCRLFTRRNDRWEQVWKSEPIPNAFWPNVIAGDFDNDGNLEVVFTPWYDLWMLEMATGKLKAKCRFTPPGAESGRAYGYLGAFDVDGDGKLELIILPDFENQMAVMGWREGTLKLLWNRLIERGIGDKKTLLRPGAEPVQDVDGDGKLEIVVSLFNAHSDDKWHLLILDALTGEEKLDVPGVHLTGMHDIDADGVPELFLTTTQGPLIPEPSDLSIISFKGGKVAHRWHTETSTFATRVITEFPMTVQNNSATQGLTVLVGASPTGGLPVFFTRRKMDHLGDTYEVVAWQFDEKHDVQRLGSISGPFVEILAAGSGVRGETPWVVRAETPSGGNAKIETEAVALKPVFSRSVGIPISTAVVGKLHPDAPPSIVVQAAGETIQAFRPGHSGAGSKVLWRVRGRSMNTSTRNAGGVVLAELDGNGGLATLAATYGAGDCARLVAMDADGREIWGHDFERFPGAKPAHNVGGLVFWFVGRFTDPHREDVLVSLARSAVHSEETFLLDGRTGKELWHRTEGTRANGLIRTLGGGFMASSDFDGDGLDDAVTMYPDGVLVFPGKTAKTLVDRSTNGRGKGGIFPHEWAFQALPAITDFLGNGKLQMLYGGTTYRLGLLDLNSNALWYEELGKTPVVAAAIEDAARGHQGRNVGNHSAPGVLQGIGDTDGDGKLELLSPGHRRAPGSREIDFHCYDAATGRLKWKLPIPGSPFGPNNQWDTDSPSTPAVADIDGDGLDEAVFAVGKTLYAVGGVKGGESGVVRWRLELTDLLGPPSIADVDGDGKAEIVVVCADGHVYGIGSKVVRA